jgi:chromosome segregation ATPase
MNTIIIFAVVELLIMCGALIYLQTRSGAKASARLLIYDEEIERRQKLFDDIAAQYGARYPWAVVRESANDLIEAKEVVKQERGRITITQAELETIENRLRELDEVEREIQASGIETKEELRILNKKEADLRTKNENLKGKIQDAISHLNSISSQIESNAQLMAQLEAIKTDLLRTEQKTDELLMQIEAGNEQYFILKQVYDALDIEYAQLYEKFADAGSS